MALADDRVLFQGINSEPVYRSFPTRAALSPPLAEYLKTVLANKVLAFDPDDPAAKKCNEMGWIHTDAVDCDGTDLVGFFPTRLHEKYFSYYLIL